MGERTQTTTGKSNSGTRKTWTLVVTGTAVLLLSAGVMLQVTRPTSAFPEDNGKAAQAGKAVAGDQGQMSATRVARVGKEFITWQELAVECIARHGKEILDNLINRKVIQQACDSQGIEISEAEVSKEIELTAKKFGLAVDQWMQMLEAEQNVTAMQYRRDIVWPKLALRKLAGEDVKVSKADVKKAFEKNYGPRVKVRAIVFDNSRRAREVWEKAQAKPEDFERLAQEHSVDPSSRALGGVIPPIPRHSGSKNLEEVAFKLKTGEISPVVQVGPSLNQYIILKCEGRTVPEITKPDDVEDILIEELREEKIQAAVHKVFEKIKSEARVDNYVTNISTGGDRKPSAAKAAGSPGTVKQAAASAPRRTASPPADEGAPSPSARPSTTVKSGGRTATAKAPARAAIDE